MYACVCEREREIVRAFVCDCHLLQQVVPVSITVIPVQAYICVREGEPEALVGFYALYIYIYIYICDKEKERERESEKM